MIVSHLTKAKPDNSRFNKSTTPQIHNTITTHIMNIARIPNKLGILISLTIHTNLNLFGSLLTFFYTRDLSNTQNHIT